MVHNASIAGDAANRKRRDDPRGAGASSVDPCLRQLGAHFINQHPRFEVVAAIDYEIYAGDQRLGGFRIELADDRFDLDFAVCLSKPPSGNLGLAATSLQVLLAEEHLPVKVGRVYCIRVNDPDLAKTGPYKKGRTRAPCASTADDKGRRASEHRLPLGAEPRQYGVSGVPVQSVRIPLEFGGDHALEGDSGLLHYIRIHSDLVDLLVE